MIVSLATAIHADGRRRDLEKLRLVMSRTPAVRSPYCAGSVPVSSDMLPTKLVSITGPKTRDPFGKHDAVDPVLDVRVFVADVKIGIGDGRIVGDAGRLQNHLVDRGVVALGQRFDRLAIDTRVGRRSDLGKQVFPRTVHRLHL